MGGEFFTIAVASTASGAKFSAGYDTCWWFLSMTHKYLGIEPDEPMREYLREIDGLRAQQRILGKRPYSKKDYTFSFPGHAGLSETAAGLWAHWLRLSIALWESEHSSYFRRYNVGISGWQNARYERGRERFVTMRGLDWSVSVDDGIVLHRQGRSDAVVLRGADLNESEREQVRRVAAGRRCACSICDMLTPSEIAEQRLLDALDGNPASAAGTNLGFWIASLLDPSAALLRNLLERVHRLHTSPASASPVGHFTPAHAFGLLSSRVPGAWSTLRERLGGETFASAAALCALRAAIKQGETSLADHAVAVEGAMLRSQAEALAAFPLLVETVVDPPLHARWVPSILLSVQAFGHNTHPGGHLVSDALTLWDRLCPVGRLPADVEAYVRHVADTFPSGHFGGARAKQLLASRNGASPDG